MKRVAMLLALCSCMSPVMHFGSGKSAHEAQHDVLTEFLPPQLAMEPHWTGDVRTAKIRVYADDDYRAQNMRWQQTFGEQLDYANAVLEPVLGLHLVAEYREWDFRAIAGSSLADNLEALRQRDPGDDVLSVVGLISSLSLVSASFEQLGLASMPGHHVIVRGYADLEERNAFTRAFPDLSGDERESALEARRRHKTTVVLLHELAHNLGADHDPEPDTLMNATYSDHAVAFTDRARQTVLATLDDRLHPHVAAPPMLPAPRELHPTLTIQIGDDGKVVDAATLDDRMRDALARDPDIEVIVEAGKQTPYPAVVKLIDRARAAGLHKIGMTTR
jgi:hypothetical protein